MNKCRSLSLSVIHVGLWECVGDGSETHAQGSGDDSGWWSRTSVWWWYISKISATTRVCSVCHKLQHQSSNSSLLCKGVGNFTFFPIRMIKGDRCWLIILEHKSLIREFWPKAFFFYWHLDPVVPSLTILASSSSIFFKTKLLGFSLWQSK